MEHVLDTVTIWLADHPRWTAALLCASILIVFALDAPN